MWVDKAEHLKTIILNDLENSKKKEPYKGLILRTEKKLNSPATDRTV